MCLSTSRKIPKRKCQRNAKEKPVKRNTRNQRNTSKKSEVEK
jgi:hypothetical protein